MTHCRIVKNHTLNIKNLCIGGSIFIVAFLAIFAIPAPVRADFTDPIGNFVAGVVGWIVQMMVRLLGWIFVKMAHILINRVAPYNDFVTAAPVGEGWVIVRDISNMFFIVILLAISFGTMFGRKEYAYNEKLPRLLIMAIFINFSRTITGIIIDASQVMMLTFVNAFQAAAGGNLATGLGINQLFEIAPNANQVGATEAVLGYILALILVAIATGVVGIILVTLVYRIVALWTITILSPAAFLMSTFERGKKYYDDWWKKLICWAFSGPILAFFLWLALATMSQAGSSFTSNGGSIDEGPNVAVQGLVTQAASEDNLIRFIVGIMMLLVGVQTAQELGCIRGVEFFKGLGQKAVGYAKSLGRRALVGNPKTPGLGGIAGSAWRGATLPGRALMATGRGQALQKGLYGAVGAVSPTLGGKLLGRMQEAPSKAFKTAQTDATRALASAPEQFMGMVRRNTGLKTPENEAVYAGRLAAALSPAGFKALVAGGVKRHGDTEEGKKKAEEEARQKSAQYFEEYQGIAKSTGNKDISDGFAEVKKKNPNLIKDGAERKKIARNTSGKAALDMDPDVLKDSDFVSGLSENAKTEIKKNGSATQIENLKTGEDAIAGGLRPDLITDNMQRAERLDQLEKAGKLGELAPETVATVFKEMTPEQQEQAVEKMDITKMNPATLTEDNGRFAARIAGIASPEQLAAVKKDKPTALAFSTGLIARREAFKKEMKARKESGTATPEDQVQFDTETKQISIALMAAGASPVDAFDGNYDGLAKALGDPTRQMSMIGNMSVETIQSDSTLRDVLAETTDMAPLLAMLSLGDKNEKKKGEMIAKTILARAEKPKTGTLSDAQQKTEERMKKIADELLVSQPTIKRLMNKKVAFGKSKDKKADEEDDTTTTT